MPVPKLPTQFNSYTGIPCHLGEVGDQNAGSWFSTGYQLGEGSYGQVFLSRDSHTSDEFAALKVVRKGHLSCVDPNVEIAALKALHRHPSITMLMEVWESPNSFRLVSQYYKGGDLFSAIRTYRPAHDEVPGMFAPILSAVCYMHDMGLAHGDIKTGNLLFGHDGRPVLADFGLTVPLHEKLMEPIGTPLYMAPEVINITGPYEAGPADAWAMGVVLYELLHADMPFQGDDRAEIRKYICAGKYQVRPDLTPDAVDLLAGLLCIHPVKRLTLRDVWLHPFMNGHEDTEKLSPMDMNFDPVSGMGGVHPRAFKALMTLFTNMDEEELLVKLMSVGANSFKVCYDKILLWSEVEDDMIEDLLERRAYEANVHEQPAYEGASCQNLDRNKDQKDRTMDEEVDFRQDPGPSVIKAPAFEISVKYGHDAIRDDHRLSAAIAAINSELSKVDDIVTYYPGLCDELEALGKKLRIARSEEQEASGNRDAETIPRVQIVNPPNTHGKTVVRDGGEQPPSVGHDFYMWHRFRKNKTFNGRYGGPPDKGKGRAVSKDLDKMCPANGSYGGASASNSRQYPTYNHTNPRERQKAAFFAWAEARLGAFNAGSRAVDVICVNGSVSNALSDADDDDDGWG